MKKIALVLTTIVLTGISTMGVIVVATRQANYSAPTQMETTEADLNRYDYYSTTNIELGSTRSGGTKVYEARIYRSQLTHELIAVVNISKNARVTPTAFWEKNGAFKEYNPVKNCIINDDYVYIIER